MRDIHRPDSTEPLVERLTTTKVAESDQAVFQTIMDLLIFSAGVGLTFQRRLAVPSSGKAVPARIFENNQKEGYIYLVALAAGDPNEVLKTDNDDVAVQIFEEYAAGGLEVIASWIHENPTDISGVQALIEGLQSKMEIGRSPSSTPDPV